MNKSFYILLLVFISCYNDDSEIIESSNAANKSSELTTMIKSMSSHKASFDDHIDKSSCFSLVFPYQLKINSVTTTINSIEDISDLGLDDDIKIVYPVTAVFFDYAQHEMTSLIEHNSMIAFCEKDFDVEPNSCMDFQYPITLKSFNEINGNFETSHLNSDKELFLFLDNLNDTDIYEIVYPIVIHDSNLNSHRINSNLEFEAVVNSKPVNCE